jgi:hypothetical protein
MRGSLREIEVICPSPCSPDIDIVDPFITISAFQNVETLVVVNPRVQELASGAHNLPRSLRELYLNTLAGAELSGELRNELRNALEQSQLDLVGIAGSMEEDGDVDAWIGREEAPYWKSLPKVSWDDAGPLGRKGWM